MAHVVALFLAPDAVRMRIHRLSRSGGIIWWHVDHDRSGVYSLLLSALVACLMSIYDLVLTYTDNSPARSAQELPSWSVAHAGNVFESWRSHW